MTALIGVLFHWIGGLAAGSFYVPFKKVKNWSWETYWLIQGIASWVFSPWIFATILTTGAVAILKAVAPETLMWTYLCGLGWGVGGLTFGLSMRYLGLSLGNAVALGFCTVFGTIIPPIWDGSFVSDVWTPTSGKVILLGLLVSVIGIFIAGKAGMEKEKGLSEEEKKDGVKEFNFSKGVFIAAFAGIMSAFFAFGFKAGTPIVAKAEEMGTASIWAGLPTLIVIMTGGLTLNFLYCVFLHIKNKSGGEYLAIEQTKESVREGNGHINRPVNWSFSMLAGLVWYLQFFFYSIAESKMGDYKFSSWTLHMASIIIFSSLWGLKLGEWRNSSPRARRLLYLSLAVLIASTVIVGLGNMISSGASTGH